MTNLSSCLIIREWFYDARHLRKSVGKDGPKTASVGETKGFHQFKKDFISSVRSSHDVAKPLNVAGLLKKLSSADSIGKTFVVEGNVLGLVDTDPQNVIKIVDSNTKIFPISKPPKGDNYHYVLNLVMTLTDSSSKDSSSVTVYLTTNEDEHHPFEQWKLIPKMQDKKNWKQVTPKQLKSFKQSLEKISNPKSKVQFAVKVFKTQKGDVFCKLVDTTFAAFN